MQKTAPSPVRIAIAIGFALSCFAILLFLWITFGGGIPLKPESYRITADFPEAYTLSTEADVRIGGVNVGKVKSLELAPHESASDPEATRVEIEIEPEYAPISSDARAILRQKTLLGETYVELTSGTEPTADAAPVALGTATTVSDAEADAIESIPEGGHLDDARVVDATQIDEIFNALDEDTRRAFQSWQAGAAQAVRDRGLDLNDALGNLDPFLFDATELLRTLDAERPAVRGLVRDTGQVFAALTEHESALAGLVRNSNAAFGALASEDEALAQTFAILPTFQREARATLERLDLFRPGAERLADELLPVAPDVAPTLEAVERFAPPLRRLFADLDGLLDVSTEGLPALSRTLDEIRPVFDGLDPFLANLNPVVRMLSLYRNSVTDFLALPPSGIADTLPKQEGQPAPRHVLRQYAYISSEILGLYPQRLATNRGNAYPQPGSLTSTQSAAEGIISSFDCKNTDFIAPGFSPVDEDEVHLFSEPPGDVHLGRPADLGFAPCWVPGTWEDFGAGDGRAPIVTADP